MKGKIFNTQEVQAILNGSKVMFREAIKNQVPIDFKYCHNEPYFHQPNNRFFFTGQNYDWWFEQCPYQVGQKIFCKEAWGRKATESGIAYKADNPNQLIYQHLFVKWRLPQLMKQEHSRITLEITDIKVERLQDISKEDAIKEGATFRPYCHGYANKDNGWSMDWSKVGKTLSESDVCLGSAQYAFGNFWNATHKKVEHK